MSDAGLCPTVSSFFHLASFHTQGGSEVGLNGSWTATQARGAIKNAINQMPEVTGTME
jgi:hypothetical protein